MKKQKKRTKKYSGHNLHLTQINLRSMEAMPVKDDKHLNAELAIAQTLLNRYASGNYQTSKPMLLGYAMYFIYMADIYKCKVSERIGRKAMIALEKNELAPVEEMLQYYIWDLVDISERLIDSVFCFAVDTVCVGLLDTIKDCGYLASIERLAKGESVNDLAKEFKVKRSQAIDGFVRAFSSLSIIFRSDLMFWNEEKISINTIRKHSDWVLDRMSKIKQKALRLSRNVLVASENLGVGIS